MTPLLEARLGRGCEVGGGTSGIPNYRSAGFCAICNGGSKLFASASHGISGTSCGSATESHSRPLEGFLPSPCDDRPPLRHRAPWFRSPCLLRIGTELRSPPCFPPVTNVPRPCIALPPPTAAV